MRIAGTVLKESGKQKGYMEFERNCYGASNNCISGTKLTDRAVGQRIGFSWIYAFLEASC